MSAALRTFSRPFITTQPTSHGGIPIGADDAILLNERGELAEASASNLFLITDGKLKTPPVEAGILPGIALYQTLLEDPETQQRSMDLVEAAFGEWAASRRKALEPLARRSIFYWLMRFTTKFVTTRSYPDEGWEIEWLEVNGDLIAYNINRCFYLEVLLEYGVPELTAQYCRVDDLIYDGLSPHAKWVRKKTLGRGDDCCGFRFERVR